MEGKKRRTKARKSKRNSGTKMIKRKEGTNLRRKKKIRIFTTPLKLRKKGGKKERR